MQTNLTYTVSSAVSYLGQLVDEVEPQQSASLLIHMQNLSLPFGCDNTL